MHGQWTRFAALLCRDLVIVAATLLAWKLHRAMATQGAVAIAAAVGVALLTVLVGYLIHEWGHLLGAWLSGSGFELPATPFETFFLFRFDAARSSRAQFFAMALGGFASSLLMVVLLVAVLPRGLLASWIALTLTTLGVLATLVIEVPEFLRVWRGGPIPNGAAFVQSADRARQG